MNSFVDNHIAEDLSVTKCCDKKRKLQERDIGTTHGMREKDYIIT